MEILNGLGQRKKNTQTYMDLFKGKEQVVEVLIVVGPFKEKHEEIQIIIKRVFVGYNFLVGLFSAFVN